MRGKPKTVETVGGGYGFPQRPTRSFGPMTVKALPFPFWVFCILQMFCWILTSTPQLNLPASLFTSCLTSLFQTQSSSSSTSDYLPSSYHSSFIAYQKPSSISFPIRSSPLPVVTSLFRKTIHHLIFSKTVIIFFNISLPAIFLLLLFRCLSKPTFPLSLSQFVAALYLL
jgi:hypothetical protein